MSTKAVPPASGPPSSPSQLPPTPAPVVVLRSAKVSSAVVVEHPATAGSPAVVRVLHKDSDNSRTSASTLKNLSNDLSELLVKNLSLKRNSESLCTLEDPSVLTNESSGGGSEGHNSDSLGLITRSKQPNRNSLCDTFSSVNKLIKLKRVSSDSSSISGYTKIYHPGVGGESTLQHSINPPPQAKFKRVEVSVQKLPSESIAPRKGIIVNQFDQLVSPSGESESVPLLVKKKSSSEAEVSSGEEALGGGSKVSNCANSAGVKFRRRIQSPAVAASGPSLRSGRVVGSILESVEEERYKRRSLQWPLGLGPGGWGSEAVSEQDEESTTVIDEEVQQPAEDGGVGEERRRKTHFRHSWNAPGYDLLLEEERSGDSKKDFASIVHNLAGLRSALANGGSHESASLLEPHSPQFSGPRPLVVSGGVGGAGNIQANRRSPVGCNSSSPVVPSMATDGSHPVSMGAQVPRKRRLEAFLKSLVGRRPSKEPPPAPPPPPAAPQSIATNVPLLSSPEIKISKSPSEHNLVEMTRSRLNISTTSLSSVHQKLWSVVPLLKKDVSCTSLAPPKSVPLLGSQPKGGLRKCETVLALTNSGQSVEPIKPQNRLRNCTSVATCSRCSSLLSLAAAGSRYSLNLSNGGFVAVGGAGTNSHLGGGATETVKNVDSLLRLTKTSSGPSSSSSSSPSPSGASSCSSSPSGSSSSSNSSSRASVTSRAAMLVAPPSPTIVTATSGVPALTPTVKFTCKLCLGEYSAENLTRISQCGCSFCTECMTAYIEFEISEGAYEVSCPDAMCPAQGIVTIGEITTLASASLVDKHHRYRLNREVELDKFRTWCPRAGCETICQVGQNQPNHRQPTSNNASSDRIVQLPASSSGLPSPCAVHCPTCREDFCSGCKKAWHPTMSCEENTRRLAADGQTDALGIPFDNDLIKCCPMCAVPIEKDEGCAQMMCKRCKHVFCWYCLASLDDDFLLRHYDKGPCKNKLGHSRASVVWHRAQVIGIFAGFGILLLVASPLLLLAAPCIVCCKCRICSGAAKLEETEVDYDDPAGLR